MIGVQCQLMICRGKIRVSNLKTFVIDSFMVKVTLMSDFSLVIICGQI